VIPIERGFSPRPEPAGAMLPSFTERRRHLTRQLTELSVPLKRLYQLTSAVWVIYAAGLSLATYGSTLLRFAQPGRWVLGSLAAVVGLGMMLRAFVPGRPEWTRWLLPLMGGTSVATFVLLLFATNFAGGPTPARIGFAVLVLTPGAMAYAHYLGEKVVAPR
jgi:hypothetical protein